MADRPKNALSPAARQRLANALAGAGGSTAPSPDQMMPAPHAVAPPGFGGSLKVDPTEQQPPGFRSPLANALATPGFRAQPDRSAELRAMLGPPLSPRAQEARANALLAQHGLPEDIWNLSHRDQADAFEKWMGANSIPYERYKANEGSRYYTIPKQPGEDASDITVRFANHSNLSRLHGTPDYNVTTDRGGDTSVDELIGVLQGWLK